MENDMMYDFGEGVSALPFDGQQTVTSQFEALPKQSIDSGVKYSRGVITTEQWNHARPFIQTLYMEDNKPFEHVAKALQKDYGFYPTQVTHQPLTMEPFH